MVMHAAMRRVCEARVNVRARADSGRRREKQA
jgi:hypothetical protein